MKKKLLYQVFAVIMMATFLVTGCGQSGNDSKASKSSQRMARQKLRIKTRWMLREFRG